MKPPKDQDPMINDDLTINEDLSVNDDLTVTQASPEVLAELSHLFGGTSDSNESPHEASSDPTTVSEPVVEPNIDPDPTAAIDSTPVDGAEVSNEPIAEVDSIAEEMIVIDDMTPAPADPLLRVPTRDDDVIEIVDDPDTAVVIDDASLERVVIVDDDVPDPTFEERQRRKTRRERLRKVKWFKLAGVVVAGFIVVVAVLASPLFAIREVNFEGTVYTAKGTIDSVTELMEGASVFTADTQAARDQMLSDPWVAEVRITTRFPGSALVEVAERVPVVWYVGEDEKARVIDARGFIIAVLEGWPTGYLQVTGVGPSLDAGTYADDVYRAAAQLVLALPDELRGRVRSLELSGGGELSMLLREGTIVRFGPPTDLQNKLVAVVVLFRRQDPASLLVVDVSTGNPTVQVR